MQIKKKEVITDEESIPISKMVEEIRNDEWLQLEVNKVKGFINRF